MGYKAWPNKPPGLLEREYYLNHVGYKVRLEGFALLVTKGVLSEPCGI